MRNQQMLMTGLIVVSMEAIKRPSIPVDAANALPSWSRGTQVSFRDRSFMLMVASAEAECRARPLHGAPNRRRVREASADSTMP